MEFLNFHRYVVGMVRILLIVALVVTVSLKHFERAPAYAVATGNTISELAIAAGISAVIVKAPDCNGHDEAANGLLKSHKYDCKAVIEVAADNSLAAADDHVPVRGSSTVSNIRPVDLPPPIA